MNTKYTKIALSGTGDDTKVHLHYNEPTDGGGRQDLDLESKDAPLDSFLAAMRGMNEFVEELLDFPTHYATNCGVHIVSLSYKKDRLSAILSVKKTLANGLSFNFNTPGYAEIEEGKPETETTMSEAMREQISVLIAEADKYRKGERSQLGMFERGNGQAEDAGGPEETDKGSGDE